MQHQGPDVTTLGGSMLAGDLKIKKIKKQLPTILLVGDSRVGKSSLYNHMRGLSLRARQAEDGTIQLLSNYEDEVNSSNSQKSVTLVPNVDCITVDKKQYNFIDMAGFDDQGRTFVEVFGVSFMLEKVFSNILQFKLILVVEQVWFMATKIENKLKPFSVFLSHFNITTLIREPDALASLANSISIVVSKARENINSLLKSLKRMIDYLKGENEKGSLQNEKKIILSIISNIYENKRIEIFRKFENDQLLSKPQILQNLNKNNWKSYSFKDSLSMQHVILLPFQKQFKALEEKKKQDVKKYKEFTNNFKLKVQQSCKLLTNFVKRAHSNWYSFEQIDYSTQYTLLEKIVKKHPYGSIDGLMVDMNIEMADDSGICLRLNVFQKLVQIGDIINELESSICGLERPHEKTKALTESVIKILLVCRSMFCHNQQFRDDFVLFMCIFRRNLIQAQNLNKIDQNSCNDIPNVLKDSLTKILSKTGNDLFTQFQANFQEKNKSQRKKIMRIMTKYGQKQSEDRNDQKKISIYLRYAEECKKKNDFENALRVLLKSFRTLQYFKIYCENQSIVQPDKKEIYEFRLPQIFKKIAQILIQQNQFKIAIRIYELFNMVSLLLATHERLLQNPKKGNIKRKKFENMDGYSKALKKYGKREKLISLYEQMIDEFIYFPKQRQQIRERLQQVIKNQLDYNEYLDKLSLGQNQWDRPESQLNSLVEDICNDIFQEKEQEVMRILQDKMKEAGEGEEQEQEEGQQIEEQNSDVEQDQNEAFLGRAQ